MITLSWIDLNDKITVKLQLSGRHIYAAFKDNIRVNDLKQLRGSLLLNINQEVVKLKYWLVYESLDGDIMITPIYDDMLPVIRQSPEMFNDPVDIRMVFKMIDL